MDLVGQGQRCQITRVHCMNVESQCTCRWPLNGLNNGVALGFGKSPIFENFQVPLNSPNNCNFGAFEGPMARVTWT